MPMTSAHTYTHIRRKVISDWSIPRKDRRKIPRPFSQPQQQASTLISLLISLRALIKEIKRAYTYTYIYKNESFCWNLELNSDNHPARLSFSRFFSPSFIQRFRAPLPSIDARVIPGLSSTRYTHVILHSASLAVNPVSPYHILIATENSDIQYPYDQLDGLSEELRESFLAIIASGASLCATRGRAFENKSPLARSLVA